MRCSPPCGTSPTGSGLPSERSWTPHIEDHIAALRELDYPPELAEERALAAMGDPTEVGRELNACYQSWFWVILGRAAAVVTAVLCILALLHVGLLGMVAESISARIYPDEDSCFAKPTATEPAGHPDTGGERRAACLSDQCGTG